LDDYPLLDEDSQEILIYNLQGIRVPRRAVVKDTRMPDCGVLVNLKSVQGLFNPEIPPTLHSDDYQPPPYQDDPYIRIDPYPLAFLKKAGNLKASSVPTCFYPLLTKINKSIRKNHTTLDSTSDPHNTSPHQDHQPDLEDISSSQDVDSPHLDSTYQPVKPVSSQFYNYSTHRVASRAGRHDSQQAAVTAAISGAYATSDKDKKTARESQHHCNRYLPAERFHARIRTVKECPTACRAELVYSINVRALSDPSG
jgi:hypothetical protein